MTFVPAISSDGSTGASCQDDHRLHRVGAGRCVGSCTGPGGIYAENNLGAASILREWLAPFSSLGAGNVVMSTTGGTDHVFVQSIGLPGFQFIQDPLDYARRVHHSNLDTLDHLKADDIRQGATYPDPRER